MIRKELSICFLFIAICLGVRSYGQEKENGYDALPQYILTQEAASTFKIVAAGEVASIFVDPSDWKGVLRAAGDLADDIHKVTGVKPPLQMKDHIAGKSILIGTIGKSQLIDGLIKEKKIDVSAIKGKWESFIIQTVDGNLIIAGSDKRGTIYGIYDISEKIGVSPWYWWADVPVKKSKSLYVKNGRYLQHSPKVKYRGIFINDESPSFTGWAKQKFGGVNSKLYIHIFELLLRLKANYLWPAMWGNAFNEDDTLSPVLANEYGIVMGTSHHEPMMRAHKEYTDRKKEIGPWDYVTNKRNLDKFFKDGLERNKNYDNLITIGMRGDGDLPMGYGGDKENMKVLHNVIDAQRSIIREVYGKDPSKVPQLWAIFTEVQRYYDAGFKVPDDVTLLFCDNNWGYIRRIGPENERNRAGGMGLYYHIDMNGGPWNDRWVNTTTIPKLREQLNLAYQTGLNRIWIVNVGDLKPKELPIDFIMRYAWNPDAIGPEQTKAYTLAWASHIFGNEHAGEIADIVSKYSKYNLMRKPEVQYPDIFSYVNYNEADSMIQLWRDVAAKAEALEDEIPTDAKAAYYQLVLYPTKASAGVAEMYYNVGKNWLYAKQGRASANDYAGKAKDLFNIDKELSNFYNDTMAHGEWKNMMSDIHIGYEHWFMPKENKLPELKEVTPLPAAAMGISVEGNESAWPVETQKLELPMFDVLGDQTYHIDVFNRGVGSFLFNAKASQPWIRLSETKGEIKDAQRISVSIDWNKLNSGENTGDIEIMQNGTGVSVKVVADKFTLPQSKESYYGGVGEFSIPAAKYSQNVKGKNAQWIFLPGLGRANSAMGIYPVTAPSATTTTAPVLEYKIYTQKKEITTVLGITPTQDVDPARGLRIAVSIDGQAPKVLDARQGFVDIFNEYTPQALALSKSLKPLPPVNKNLALNGYNKPRRNEIFDDVRWLDTKFDVNATGFHTLKVYMIDPEIVLENIVVDPDNAHPSYFGAPPEEHFGN